MFADFCALFGTVWRLIADSSWQSIDIFLDVPVPWRSMVITHVCRQSFAELLAHSGTALAMPKFLHRKSIGGHKRLCGAVELERVYDAVETVKDEIRPL